MKKTSLITVAVFASCFGAPAGFRTANAGEKTAEPAKAPVVEPDVQKQLADQAAQIKELKKQLDETGDQATQIKELKKQIGETGDQASRIADLERQLAGVGDQSSRIAELERQLAASRAAFVEPTSSTLVLLCKGAGVDLADVRWRVAAGLDEAQAVEAAVAQQAADAARKEEEE